MNRTVGSAATWTVFVLGALAFGLLAGIPLALLAITHDTNVTAATTGGAAWLVVFVCATWVVLWAARGLLRLHRGQS